MKRLRNESADIVINLANIYPVSFRYVWQSSFLWLVLLGLLGALAFGINAAVADPTFLTYSNGALIASTILVAFGVIVKTIYGMLYRQTYFYGIEGRHFVISKGILLKQRRSCPFNHITDFYIGRSLVDFIFGLYYLEVRTPALDHGNAGKIDGLTFGAATALQNYLTDLLNEGDLRSRPAETDYREHRKFPERVAPFETHLH